MKSVGIERCRPEANLPFYACEGDAGMDVMAAEEIILRPGETKAIATGLKFVLPNDMEIQVRPRSGLSLKTPLRLANSPGTVDAGYRDELRIILTNSSCSCSAVDTVYDLTEANNSQGTYRILPGDRIAQLVFASVSKVSFIAADEAIDSLETTEDRGGGFGSTGVRKD